jgi:hypothetical protein
LPIGAPAGQDFAALLLKKAIRDRHRDDADDADR